MMTGPRPPWQSRHAHYSLIARLDRLRGEGPGQLGATLGRGLSYERLQAGSPWAMGPCGVAAAVVYADSCLSRVCRAGDVTSCMP